MFKSLRSKLFLALALGALSPAVVAISTSLAGRNGAGTYALPLTPVVSGTAITPSWANTTMNDLGNELTNSLARDGSGSMGNTLKLWASTGGGAAAPTLTWSGDTDTGLYRVAANNPAVAVGGSKIQDWTTTGTTITGTAAVTGLATVGQTLDVTGAQTNAAGVTVTQSTSNGFGVTSTGNGSGAGGKFTGGTSACGLTAYASGAIAVPTDYCGVAARGSASNNGAGVVGFGGGTGSGVVGIGVSADRNTNTYWAVEVGNTGGNGHMKLSGGNPDSTTGFKNALTPMNLVKAWALVHLVAGAPTILAGFNVAGVGCSGSQISVAINEDMAGLDFGTIANMHGMSSRTGVWVSSVHNISAGSMLISAYEGSVPAQIDLCSVGASGDFTIMALGAQ